MPLPQQPRTETTERFRAFLDLVYDHGGRYQRKLRDLCADLDVTEKKLRGIINRAQELGILDITKNLRHHVVGAGSQGTLPNIYHLKITPEEFAARQPELTAALRERERVDRANAKAARDGRKASLVVPEPVVIVVPYIEPDPRLAAVDTNQEIDVDAWTDAVDFDWPES